MTTNFDKLARWNADWYNSLSDDDCIVCLSQKQLYLLQNNLQLVEWERTRWTGDTSGMDFKQIRSELEYKLSEDMTCQNLADILTKITQLEQKIDYIFNETVENEGDTVVTEDTPVSAVTPVEAWQDLFFEADACDTAGKDALWAGVVSLVDYIIQNNQDFLENLSQSGGIPEQVGRLISATPVVGWLPYDEAFEYTAFLVNELLDNYNAVVDENLKNQTYCDLFCIAVANSCRLDVYDVYNYFLSKVDPSFANISTTLADLITFAVTGTFVTDMYFYFLCSYQMTIVALGEAFGRITALDFYMPYLLAGLNSPDHDWTIHCTEECPEYYRLYTHDFTTGLGDWTIDFGTLEGGRIRGSATPNPKLAFVKMTFDPTWRLIGALVNNERIDGISNGSHDTRSVLLRPTPDSSSGQISVMAGGFLGNGVRVDCVDQVGAAYWSTGNQIAVIFGVSEANPATCEIYIDKVQLLFEVNYAKPGSVITTDSDLCT